MVRPLIFFSSTFRDLELIRTELLLDTLKLECVPDGMELFGPRGEKSLNVIYDKINQCDLYVLIIAGMYGSEEPSKGISFTELEFDYALKTKGSQNMRCFIFYDLKKLLGDQIEEEERKKIKLVSFISKVKERFNVSQWKDYHHLLKEINYGISNWRNDKINMHKGLTQISNNSLERPESIVVSLESFILKHINEDNRLQYVIKNTVVNLKDQLLGLGQKSIRVPTYILYEEIVNIINDKKYHEYYVVDHAIFRWHELNDPNDNIAYNTFNYSSTIIQNIDARKDEANYFFKRLFLISIENIKDKENKNNLLKIIENIEDNIENSKSMNIINRFFVVSKNSAGLFTYNRDITYNKHIVKLKDLKDIVLVKNKNEYIKFKENIDFSLPPQIAADTTSHIEIIQTSKARDIIDSIEQILKLAYNAKEFINHLKGL